MPEAMTLDGADVAADDPADTRQRRHRHHGGGMLQHDA